MCARRLESVLVRYPVDGDDGAIWGRVRVRATGYGTDVFGFRPYFLLISTLLDFRSVRAHIAGGTVKAGKVKRASR